MLINIFKNVNKYKKIMSRRLRYIENTRFTT